MLLPILFAVLALDRRPFNLGAMTLDRARTLDGKPVTVFFIAAKQAYTLIG